MSQQVEWPLWACVNSSGMLPQNMSTLLKYIQRCFQWQQRAVSKGEALGHCWHKLFLSTPIKWLPYHSWLCTTQKQQLLGPGLFSSKNSGIVLHNVLIICWSSYWQWAMAAQLGCVPSTVHNTCYWGAKSGLQYMKNGHSNCKPLTLIYSSIRKKNGTG